MEPLALWLLARLPTCMELGACFQAHAYMQASSPHAVALPARVLTF
jgi:hypothetical protein